MSAGPPCSDEPDHRRDEADQDGQLGDRQAAEGALGPLALAPEHAPAALDLLRRSAPGARRARRGAWRAPPAERCPGYAACETWWTSAEPRTLRIMSEMARRLASLLAAVILVAARGGGRLRIRPRRRGSGQRRAPGPERLLPVLAPGAPAACSARSTPRPPRPRRPGYRSRSRSSPPPVDLGVIPELFGQPQNYAKFLDKEISFQGPQPLLVVMPAGYGVAGRERQGRGGRARASRRPRARRAPRSPRRRSPPWPRSPPPTVTRSRAWPGSPAAPRAAAARRTPLLIGLIVAAVLVAGALILLRRGRARSTAG